MCIKLALLSTPVLSAPVLSGEMRGADNLCYSTYNVQQKIQHSMRMGVDSKNQVTVMDLDIHVREIKNIESNALVNLDHAQPAKDIISYVGLIIPNKITVNGIDGDLSELYQHPFLTTIDKSSGKVLSIRSSTDDTNILSNYLSVVDLFQYSTVAGKYRYKNANGQYDALISKADNNSMNVVKTISGYLKTSKLKREHSSTQDIIFSKGQLDCFYTESSTTDEFRINISSDAYIFGESSVFINADDARKLTDQHYFYSLTNDVSTWPKFKLKTRLTREQAFSQFPLLISKLTSLLDNDDEFLIALKASESSWSHLVDYIVEQGVNTEVSLKLIGSLNRINSKESVNVLVDFASGALPQKEKIHAAMALGRSSAAFTEDGMQILKAQMNDITGINATGRELIFIRMLGSMAENRNENNPQQSNDMRQFLYSQAGQYSEHINAAVIDSIGNLKDSIDIAGEEILLQSLTVTSPLVRKSAVSALKRVPYKTYYTDSLISQIENESSVSLQSNIIKVLGGSNNTDLVAKQKLISIIETSGSTQIKNASLSSLKRIDFPLKSDDISVLESKLSHEKNVSNQKLLAALIMKHRRLNK